MENTKMLRRTLWMNVAFAEVSAIAAIFLSSAWLPLREMTGGSGTLFGIELFIFAGLLSYAAWKPSVSKGLLWFIVALNFLLFVFFASRLMSGELTSLISMELISIDAIVVLALTLFLIKGIQGYKEERAV